MVSPLTASADQFMPRETVPPTTTTPTATPNSTPTPTPENKEDEDPESGGLFSGMIEVINSIHTTVTNISDILKKITNKNLYKNFVMLMMLDTFSSVFKTAVEFIIDFTDETKAIFDSPVGQLLVGFAAKLGWLLWVIGSMLAIVDIGIKYKENQALYGTMQDLGLNLFKSFFAVLLFTTVPLPLYLLVSDAAVKISTYIISDGIGSFAAHYFDFDFSTMTVDPIWTLIFVLIYIFTAFKVIFASIKRGGTLLILVLIGSLHMFSVPRGYWDAFFSWCRQILALCITHFCQYAIFLAGFTLFAADKSFAGMIAGLSLSLASAEVPRIADRFGMDTSVRANVSQAAMTVSAIVRIISVL